MVTVITPIFGEPRVVVEADSPPGDLPGRVHPFTCLRAHPDPRSVSEVPAGHGWALERRNIVAGRAGRPRVVSSLGPATTEAATVLGAPVAASAAALPALRLRHLR